MKNPAKEPLKKQCLVASTFRWKLIDRCSLPPKKPVKNLSWLPRLSGSRARALIFRLKPEATQSIYSQGLKGEATQRFIQETESTLGTPARQNPDMFTHPERVAHSDNALPDLADRSKGTTRMTAEDSGRHDIGDEYEREPVPERARLGFKSFIGQYAGEHTAGTELMIGPLFVASGVSAVDLIGGLFVGNLLAVLSWTFLTAPIATRARLTLYYQLEKICGRRLVTLYNVANGLMFCFLAGSMVTVSATALGVLFDFAMPELTDVYPNSLGWILAVFALGVAMTLVAAYGYAFVARVANIASPWMVLVFIAFGLVGLRQLGVTSFAGFWDAARDVIWIGGDPLPGQTKFTFWHTMFFAWFCNMAMHIGMADLSVFRFASHSWYGLATASGMYLGHYIAWIAASILYVVQLRTDPGNTAVLPGPLAYRACGIAGLICVVVAGWTTANPTIYRAGLAFQAIAPRYSRYRVTLLTGLITTVAGTFPAIAMKLLDFVALYGMVLMPMGAVVFIDFWLSGRFGFQSNYAERAGLGINWAAGLTWFATLAGCTALVLFGGVQIYFVSLPGWFLAAALYIVLSRLLQRRILHIADVRPPVGVRHDSALRASSRSRRSASREGGQGASR
jgi:purine-cytosine permease-like protein